MYIDDYKQCETARKRTEFYNKNVAILTKLQEEFNSKKKKRNNRANKCHTLKIVNAIAEKEINEHLGRWCELTLKATGEKLKIVRTGYGPMEYPERDKHEIYINDKLVGKFNDLYEVAKWICNRKN